MPLSEHEERILAEIERQLVEEDPRFVQRARKVSAKDVRARRLRWSVVGFVLGFALLLGLTFDLVIGLVGFGLMLTSLVIGGRAIAEMADDDRTPLAERFKRAFRRTSDDTTG